jgi:hypothetical protein
MKSKIRSSDADYRDNEVINPRDFEISQPEESPQRQRVTSGGPLVPKSGRPTTRRIYEFNKRDKEIIAEAIKHYGNAHALIAKEYFSDCDPPVTRNDIANLIKNTPHLRELAKMSMLFSVHEVSNF